MRTRYNFVGRDGDFYLWEAAQATDSRTEHIRCHIRWFWEPEFRRTADSQKRELEERWAEMMAELRRVLG